MGTITPYEAEHTGLGPRHRPLGAPAVASVLATKGTEALPAARVPCCAALPRKSAATDTPALHKRPDHRAHTHTQELEHADHNNARHRF